MHFRSYADLAHTLTTQLGRVPRDVDLIVGIPRSGLIPATVLSLGLNVPMTDIDGLLAGRLVITGAARRTGQGPASVSCCRHALVIDDSILSGSTLATMRQRISAAHLPLKITFAAVYTTRAAADLVDLRFEVCPLPRLFEWNYLHHHQLGSSAVDLDGVLGLDATRINAASPEKRRGLLESMLPSVRPTHRVRRYLSRCAEPTRSDLCAWLHRHSLAFDFLDLPATPAGVIATPLDGYLAFKASIYRRDHGATVFLDGTPGQSDPLSQRAGKAVIAVHERCIHQPNPLSFASLQQRTYRLQRRAVGLVRHQAAH
jgi:hypothetical protein